MLSLAVSVCQCVCGDLKYPLKNPNPFLLLHIWANCKTPRNFGQINGNLYGLGYAVTKKVCLKCGLATRFQNWRKSFQNSFRYWLGKVFHTVHSSSYKCVQQWPGKRKKRRSAFEFAVEMTTNTPVSFSSQVKQAQQVPHHLSSTVLCKISIKNSTKREKERGRGRK